MNTLHDACCKGELMLVKSLLDQGEPVNGRDDAGRYPMHYAVDLTLLCRWFNKKGADRSTVLHFITDISESIAALLLTRGALVNVKDNKGSTPLHVAAAENNNKVLTILLKNNSDVNALDCDGRIALHYSASAGNLEGTKMLIDKGSDVNACDDNGNTPIHLAVDKEHLEVCQLLLRFGSKVNIANKWFQTPFLIASAGRNRTHAISMLKLLLENGADATATSYLGETAIHAAVESENAKVLEFILNHSADPDVNMTDKNGETALNVAVLSNDCEIIKLLLLYGADVDSLDSFNWPPFYNVIIHLYDSENEISYINKTLNVLSTLLDHHANLTLPNVEERSSLDIIMSCNVYLPIKKLIYEYLIKVKAANIPFGKRYTDKYAIIRQDSFLDPSFYQNCEAEVKLMKEKKLANVSFHKILTVPISRLVFYLRNQQIEDGLAKSSYEQFPIYSSFMEARFALAARRKHLLKVTSPFFTEIISVKPPLTYDCVEYVLSFLTNRDLQRLTYLC